MKLEVGSGHRPTPGFTHLDIRPDAPGVDVVADATSPQDWDIGQPIDEIRATHVLEHFSHRDTTHILRLWRYQLQPGGRVYLEVPNLSGHVREWQRLGAAADARFVTYLFGEQDYPENFHKTMFTAGTLFAALRDAGFQRIDVKEVGLVLIAEGFR